VEKLFWAFARILFCSIIYKIYIKGENIADEKFFAFGEKNIFGYSLPEILFKLRTGRKLSLPGLFLFD